MWELLYVASGLRRRRDGDGQPGALGAAEHPRRPLRLDGARDSGGSALRRENAQEATTKRSSFGIAEDAAVRLPVMCCYDGSRSATRSSRRAAGRRGRTKFVGPYQPLHPCSTSRARDLAARSTCRLRTEHKRQQARGGRPRAAIPGAERFREASPGARTAIRQRTGSRTPRSACSR